MTGNDLMDLFRRHVPADAERKLIRGVFSAHREAGRICSDEFEPTEAQNIIGYVRRGKVEGALREVAAVVSGIDAVVLKGEGGWNHTEWRAGPVVLTASAVPGPCALVEPAGFRTTLAEDNQMLLFPDPAQVLPDDAPLYAILLHSRFVGVEGTGYQRYRNLPGSIYIAFPTPSLNGYAHAINLLDEHPDVLDSLLPKEWNEDVRLRYRAAARVRRAA